MGCQFCLGPRDGSQIVKVVPVPGSLLTSMRPPCASTRRCAIAKPSPLPLLGFPSASRAVVHADHSAVISDHVTLGHGVVCHASKVGDHALLGNGCVVNEGATIGRHALVAANSVVLEGADVADETVVAGAPARVRGQIAKRHREMMDDTWRHYVAKTAEFKREGGLE